MKRPALFLILGLVIGAVAGCYATTRWWVRPSQDLGDMLVLGIRGQYAYLQYQNAKPAEAKAALNEYLQTLDSVQARGNTSRSIWVDRGLTYMRLSKLETTVGNKTDSDRYLTRAQEAFKAAGWKDTSPEYITGAIERLDSKAPKADRR